MKTGGDTVSTRCDEVAFACPALDVRRVKTDVQHYLRARCDWRLKSRPSCLRGYVAGSGRHYVADLAGGRPYSASVVEQVRGISEASSVGRGVTRSTRNTHVDEDAIESTVDAGSTPAASTTVRSCDAPGKLGAHCGVEQLVARQAHNLEVGGSNPPPATGTERRKMKACGIRPISSWQGSVERRGANPCCSPCHLAGDCHGGVRLAGDSSQMETTTRSVPTWPGSSVGRAPGC